MRLRVRSLVVVGVLTQQAACGGAMPNELVDARAALLRAESGPAAKYNPAGLHVARGALDDAEKSYELHGADYRTRDRSYAVIRKVERVETLARTRKYETETEELQHRIWMGKLARYMELLRDIARSHDERSTP